MGTRGLTGFVVDGEEKLSYQQFDSYPSGVGAEVLTWLRIATDSVDALRDRARAIKLVGGDDSQPPTAEEIEKLTEYADTGVSTGELTEWYVLLRKQHGRPDLMVESGYMTDDATFVFDSLFCEWGYVIDLDAETFEVYRGFQTEYPTAGRWAGRPNAEEKEKYWQEHLALAKKQGREPWRPQEPEYKAVTLVASWPLSALPDDDTFIAETEKKVYGAEDDD